MTRQERKAGLWLLFVAFITIVVYSCVTLGPRDTLVAVVTAAFIVGAGVWVVEGGKPRKRPPGEASRLRRVVLVKENGVEVVLDTLSSSAVVVDGAQVVVTVRPEEIRVRGKGLSCSVCGRVEEELTVTERGSVCKRCKSPLS